MELKGAVAIVTGGSGGLGGRISRALAAAGSVVAPTYNSNRERAEAVAKDVREEFKVEAEVVQCDVTDPLQVRSAVS